MTYTSIVAQTPLERLKAVMAINDVTQQDIARLLNISRPAVSRKLGGYVPFTLEETIKLADKFNLSLDYLVGRGEDAY